MRLDNKNSFSLKVMTYNVHSCINIFGQFDTGKIVDVIKNLDPDVVALQEVESRKSRSNYINQARYIARQLNMAYHFFPLVQVEDEKYGLAIMGKYPFFEVKYDRLSALQTKFPREIRGAMWVKIKTPAGYVNLVNTHFGLMKKERKLQIRDLLGRKWLKHVMAKEPVILCGDLNAGIFSPVYKKLAKNLSDAQVAVKQKGYPRPTFYSISPFFRLDHIFVSAHLSPVGVVVPRYRIARIASDHLPIFCELRFNRSVIGA